MALSPTDPRWSELRGSYGDPADIVALLNKAHRDGGLSHQDLGDLINEIQHQGDTSTAMYAVAAHLIALAGTAPRQDALTLLTHAGLVYASSDQPGAVACPVFLQEEFRDGASQGAERLATLLPLAADFDAFRWAVAALAGFMGHHSFGRLLGGLDLFEGQFHHALLDKPFPRDV